MRGLWRTSVVLLEILRNIVETAQASLTDKERTILQGANERLRRGR